MRAVLEDSIGLAEALAPDFTLSPRNQDLMVVTELTEHFSNSQLVEELQAIKTIAAVNVVFYLVGLWGLTAFWSITARGRACRAQAHSSWTQRFLPTSETLQVFVLNSFFQLILCLLCHMTMPYMPEEQYTMITAYLAVVVGIVGAFFQGCFNSWVRGESLSLRAALAVDQIDKDGGGDEWADEEREYRVVYEAGGDRTLGQLAVHDWEQSHLDMERQLGLMDISDQAR